MTVLKRIFGCILSVTLLIVAATGCASKAKSNLSDAFTQAQSEELPISISSFEINGVDISQYRIVYATSFSREACYEDYGMFAEELSKTLEQLTGRQIPVVADSEAAAPYEILLGPAARAECVRYSVGDTALKDDECCVMYLNGKLLLGATSLAGVVSSGELFIEYISKEAVENDGVLKLGRDFNISAERHVTRIVCVGDSITQGTNLTDDRRNSYPAKLQAQMGYRYDVVNYGRGGTTMCSNSLREYANNSYISTSGYYDALIANADKTDVVVIMLGTNDAKDESAINNLLTNHLETFKADFKQNLTKMVNDLRDRNKDIKIILFSSPKCYRAPIENNLDGFVRPYQRQVAAELGIDFYDMFAFTDTQMSAQSFPDQIHPDVEGYEKIASEAARMLKSTYSLD